MKIKIFILSFILIVCSGCKNKTKRSFDGQIQYVIKIETFNDADSSKYKELRDNFGDTVEITFRHPGMYLLDFKNSGDSGLVSLHYENGEGNELIKRKKSLLTKESVNLRYKSKEKKHLKDKKIIGYDCKCMSFETEDYIEGKIIFNYCYNDSTPYVNSKYFSKYQLRCAKDFFEATERPFLLYSQETKDVKITFTAVNISEL